MNNRQERRKRNIGIAAIIIIVFAIVLACFVIAVKTGIVSLQKSGTDAFTYSSDENSAYCPVGDGMAVLSTDGLKVFEGDGTQTLNEKFIMSTPALCYGGKNALCYDIGGTTVKLFTEDKILQTLDPDGNVTYASMNSEGMACLCCEESGYHGAVMVFDNYGTLIYKWMSGTGYIINAAVSASGDKLCVLTTAENGTNVIFLSLKDENYSYSVFMEGELLFDLSWMKNGVVRAISLNGLYELQDGKDAELIMSFDGRHIDDYMLGDMTILALKEFKSGGNCDIIKIEENGEEFGIAEFENGIISVSATEYNTAVITDSGLYIFNTRTAETKAHYDAASYLKVFMRKDGTALCIGRHSTDVYSARADERGI